MSEPEPIFASSSDNRPDAGVGLAALSTVVPAVLWLAMLLYFASWRGAGLTTLAALLVGSLAWRRYDAVSARRALASWGCYLNPGYTGPIDFVLSAESGVRTLEMREVNREDMDTRVMLEDGAVLDWISGTLHDSRDARFTAALNRHSLLVYDRQRHLVYRYLLSDAARRYQKAFTSHADGLAIDERALQALLDASLCTPLSFYQGLWLEASLLPPSIAHASQSNLTRQLPGGLRLEAVAAFPDDLRTLERPLGALATPLYRLWLGGAPTFLWLQAGDLNQAKASSDGRTLIVPGVSVDPGGKVLRPRLFIWRAASASDDRKGREGRWHSLDPLFYQLPQDGQLGRVEKIDGDRALLHCTRVSRWRRSPNVTTSWQVRPLKVTTVQRDGQYLCWLKLPE